MPMHCVAHNLPMTVCVCVCDWFVDCPFSKEEDKFAAKAKYWLKTDEYYKKMAILYSIFIYKIIFFLNIVILTILKL